MTRWISSLVVVTLVTAGACSSSPQTPADVVVAGDLVLDATAADTTVVPPDAPAPGDGPVADLPADLTADVAPPPADMTGLVVLPYDGGPVEVTEASFACLTDWDLVRAFRIASLTGRLEQALAVANDPEGKAYPVGTVIQIVPGEAMVKREPGFSPGTGDWEFFELAVSSSGTTIRTRATQKSDCYGCHAPAGASYDYICENDHGCEDLGISDAVLLLQQMNDPRCP